jgi:predicted acetyltransferase
MFKFQDPGKLIDHDLELVVAEKRPGNPILNYVPTYRCKMMHGGQNKEMGAIDLRVGNTHHIVMYGGHIGYSVFPAYRGHHYAARSVRLLLPLAYSHGLDTLWITCNPDNFASRRTCELAGFTFVEIVDLPPDTDMYREGERQKCRYRRML